MSLAEVVYAYVGLPQSDPTVQFRQARQVVLLTTHWFESIHPWFSMVNVQSPIHDTLQNTAGVYKPEQTLVCIVDAMQWNTICCKCMSFPL